MDSCDILIVGGGPAGSSCAWKLRHSGLSTVILDKQHFPRDKTCGGWITPPILEELEIDATEYARHHVFQPIHGFRVSRMTGHEVETDYGQAISFGIRRYEFDHFLLQRCGARVQEGTAVTTLERSSGRWIVNGQLSAPLIIGAGGHFCPVARLQGASSRRETGIAAQEIEFEMAPAQCELCTIRPEIPEVYFCEDMKGYGWCLRKKNFLNIGLGRLDPRALPQHVAGFIAFLKKAGKVSFELPQGMVGHSYLLYGCAKRSLTGDGVLLVGDAAGLAYPQSGEGIRPAIESGLLAAKAILSSREIGSPRISKTYRTLLEARFGKMRRELAFTLGRHLPARTVNRLTQFLLATRWFSRRIVLERWFLHLDEPAMHF
jgi:geranylgeranyl reductase family protein